MARRALPRSVRRVTLLADRGSETLYRKKRKKKKKQSDWMRPFGQVVLRMAQAQEEEEAAAKKKPK